MLATNSIPNLKVTMTQTRTVYGRGWNPIDLTGPLGDVEVLIEFVISQLTDCNMSESEIDIVRENLEELSLNYNEFLQGVADYIGPWYSLYKNPTEYKKAEEKWQEYQANDWVIT